MIAHMSRFLCVFSLFLLVSCASEVVLNKGTAEGDYNHAKYLLDQGVYGKANVALRKFSTDYPYSKYVVKADLLRVYAAYKAEEYILAETLAENFLSKHPTYPDIPYIKYLLAMSYYQQIEESSQDQTYTKSTIDAFERLLKEHPDSHYAKEGLQHLNRLYTQLAEKEMHVGHYYFGQKRYVASANRFLYVVEHYQTISVIEEAMYYLTLSYNALKMPSHAHDIAQLLRHNYPNSKWVSKLSKDI